MKKCPQCSKLYGDETLYCLTDGALLVGETFEPPSELGADEPETVIRNAPLVFDLSRSSEPSPSIAPASPENVIATPANATSANKNYALFLVLGLLIGGGLVLATLLISKNLFQNEAVSSVQVERAANNNPAAKTEPSPENGDNGESAIAPVDTGRHAQRAETREDDDFNGRVIAINARVRAAPERDAPVADTLPMNDRLNIVGRENARSPWFEVECEHGATGWMHGDTIEFTRPPL